MKYIRAVSDIHLNFDIGAYKRRHAGYEHCQEEMDALWYPPAMPGDEDTCLVLAGDLWEELRHLTRRYQHGGDTWLDRLARRFKYIVYVLGNHDYWGENMTTIVGKARKYHDLNCPNVHLLDASTVVLDQVKFTGGIMWTNFNRGNPLTMYMARNQMKPDYRYIRVGPDYRKMRPEDCLSIFNKTANHIFENTKRDVPEQKVVVVTHMAPSYQSIHQAWRTASGEVNNPYYYSDLDNRIAYEGTDIDLWFHGHCHAAADYKIENTRVVCNPRGYVGEIMPTPFDPFWRVEL